MRRSDPKVTYSDYQLRMPAPARAGMDRFDATASNYNQQLAARPDIQEGPRTLIRALFQAGAIVSCTITYGDHMDLHLKRVDPSGKPLSATGAFEQFQSTYAQITGGDHISPAAPRGRARRARAHDWSGGGELILRGLGAVFNFAGDVANSILDYEIWSSFWD